MTDLQSFQEKVEYERGRISDQPDKVVRSKYESHVASEIRPRGYESLDEYVAWVARISSEKETAELVALLEEAKERDKIDHQEMLEE